MLNQQLCYSEKLQLLSDLRKFYMNDFGRIYNEIPEELGRLKGLSIGLILDSLKTIFKGNKIPAKEEIILVFRYILNHDFLNDIYDGREEPEISFMKSGFGCAFGILLGDKKIIKIEKEELEKIGGFEIKCSLI